MQKDKLNAWKGFRNRWVYFNGKKVKLRKYIVASANLMAQQNKKGWHRINHLQNYKNALALYGFAGLKIYEDRFYKDIPFPEDRTWFVKLGLKLAPKFTKLLNLIFTIKNYFKR